VIEVLLLLGFMVAVMIRGVSYFGPTRRARRLALAKARAQLDAGSTELVDGALVTVIGQIDLVGDALDAPLSGRPCVAYAARVRGTDRAGRRSEAGTSAMAGFVVTTRERVIAVEGGHVVVTLPLIPVIPEDRARSQRYGDRVELEQVSEPYEAIVESGARLAVSGRLVIERDVDKQTEAGYRDEPTRARLVGSEEQPITIAQVG
jgi:hypothetical protein